MSTEQNKAAANRIPEEFNKKNLAILDEVAAPNAVDHAVPPGMPETIESTKKFFGMLLSAFPDFHTHVENTVAEGDFVFQRTITHGTMKGEFLGMKPTGKEATWQEMHLVRFANGKVVEHWANIDLTSMMQQLGTMPPQ